MSFGDLELHGHYYIVSIGVNQSDHGTRSTTNHIFYTTLEQLHDPRCKQPEPLTYKIVEGSSCRCE